MFSGIVGTYPVVTTVVMTFTHHQFGREAAIAMLRGSVLSWIGFVSSFFAVGLAIKPYGLAVSLGFGVLAAVGTTILVLWVDGLASRITSPHAVPSNPPPE
jgi:protein-S-isoprenylcysteine O-methyltransferase Ste14